MDYELARKLKDAGFPFRRCEYAYCNDGVGECAYCDQPAITIGTEFFIVPTLEELIEACGEALSDLVKCPDRWIASAAPSNGSIIDASGATPTEAVARLWLALNKKV